MTEFQVLGTFAIALFAAVIALGQWWTARQKLALDLFEKRFQVFLEVRKAASEAFQLGKLVEPGMINETIARARFLFGDDVTEPLKKFHQLAIGLELNEPSTGHKMSQAYEEMIPFFERYLSLKDKPPKLI
jgi:hypothetical protein